MSLTHTASGRGALRVAAREKRPGTRRVDRPAAERAVRDLLGALGADLADRGLSDTPRRVAAAYVGMEYTGQALIRSRAPVDPRRLTDPDVPLAELVPPAAREATRG